jgi:hypothetical protein
MRHVSPTSVTAGAALSASSFDPITEDLRSYARELGVAGASSMDKDELVESLRQFYILQKVLGAATHDRPVSGR